MMNKSLCLLLVALLSACAGQVANTNYYLLRSDQELTTRELDTATAFAMGSVTIAPYIDQAGLLLETSPGDFRPALHHLWAEPLHEGVRALLLAEISREKGQDILPAGMNSEAIRFDVRIDQLHGTHDGMVKLVAYWWLHQGGEMVKAHQFAESRPLDQDGYAALVRTEKSLLSDLAKAIAATLLEQAK